MHYTFSKKFLLHVAVLLKQNLKRLNIAFAVFSDIWTTVLFRNRNDTEKITHNIKFNIKLRKTSNSTLNEAT